MWSMLFPNNAEKYRYKNIYLEKYFANVERPNNVPHDLYSKKQHDLWQDKLEANSTVIQNFERAVSKTKIELFPEHFNNFKPTLDEIKARGYSEVLYEAKVFIKKDLTNLF